MHTLNLMDSSVVAEILDTAEKIERSGSINRRDEPLILGKMLHNPSPRENQIVDLTAARSGFSAIDFSWRDFTSTETSVLFDEVRMVSEAVDVLITAISSEVTFGEGRDLSTRIPEHSKVPVVNIHDDVYHWQSALSHLFGIKKGLGSLVDRQIVITWVYGSTFANPSLAHATMMTGILAGANIRVAAPSDFPLLGRVRKDALKSISGSDAKLEFTSDFDTAFTDAEAVIPLNWFRLDNFNHPDRNPQYASAHKNWFLETDPVPEDCILSTEPDLQVDLSIAPELQQAKQNISSSWLSRRVITLASTISYILDSRESDNPVSLV